jgi:phage-related protein
MPRWKVEVTAGAEAELKALATDLQARFLRVAELLEASGPQNVGMPHVRHLEGRLWEMRLKGKGGIARAVYFATKGARLIVVHVFAKKTEKTPRGVIELAEKRMKDWSDG